MKSAAGVTIVRRRPRIMTFFDVCCLVEGVLLEIEEIQIQGKPATQYTVSGKGESHRFLGTNQINQKIHADDIGSWVRVRCAGEEQLVILSETEYANDVIASTT